MKSPLQNPLLFYHSRGQPASHRLRTFDPVVVEHFVRSASSVQNRWTSRLSIMIFHEYRTVYFDFLSRESRVEILVLALDRRKILWKNFILAGEAIFSSTLVIILFLL